jgi:RimJ/RimL family protein N-acetyltransferase
MKIIYRTPKKTDLDGLLSFVNELTDEDTYVTVEWQTRNKEKKWLEDQLKAIRKKNLVMIVAEVDGKIVGNCEIRRRAAYKRVRHIGTFGIMVRRKFRGKGIGERLMKTTMADAKKRMGVGLLTLSVLANNPIAPKLYKKMGFRECGRLPRAFLFMGKYIDEIYMFRGI